MFGLVNAEHLLCQIVRGELGKAGMSSRTKKVMSQILTMPLLLP